ncbi:MAG: hypothetical protein ACOY0T_16060 [Myxococcota bacterium]
MARSSLFRGVAFALVAGACAPFVSLVLALSTNYPVTLASLLAVPLYLSVVSSDLRRGVRAGSLAMMLALPCAFLVRDDAALFALSLVILSICRSSVLHPRPFARALFLEPVFIGLGVAGSAIWWDGGGSLRIAFATWSFWLVQAGFTLTAASTTPAEAFPADPFERACAAAEAVLAGKPR